MNRPCSCALGSLYGKSPSHRHVPSCVAYEPVRSTFHLTADFTKGELANLTARKRLRARLDKDAEAVFKESQIGLFSDLTEITLRMRASGCDIELKAEAKSWEELHAHLTEILYRNLERKP